MGAKQATSQIKDDVRNDYRKISIKCTYLVKDVDKEVQILNNSGKNEINAEIEKKIKILNNNRKEKIALKKKFDKIGLNTVDFVIEGKLNNLCFMFKDCSALKNIEFIFFDTKKATHMKANHAMN